MVSSAPRWRWGGLLLACIWTSAMAQSPRPLPPPQPLPASTPTPLPPPESLPSSVSTTPNGPASAAAADGGLAPDPGTSLILVRPDSPDGGLAGGDGGASADGGFDGGASEPAPSTGVELAPKVGVQIPWSQLGPTWNVDLEVGFTPSSTAGWG